MGVGTKEELAEPERRMRELIALLDGANSGVAALERAWSACVEHGPALDRAARSAAAAAGEERKSLRKQLERLVELNAIARQAIQDEEHRVEAELLRLRGAKSALHVFASPVETGESCDVSG